jgi:hypothetical protein
MSDFEMLVDADVMAEEAEDVSRAVLGRFRELGLITGKLSDECVLGGKGYRPGPAVADLYKLRDGERRFWELVTCGVEPVVARGFNVWALGPSFEGFLCPSCAAKIEIEPSFDPFGNAVG